MKQLLMLALTGLAAVPAAAQISFTSDYECGNATDFTELAPNVWSFAIEPDTNSTDRQWYDFTVTGAEGETLEFRLPNINNTNVSSHWSRGRPVFSTDGGDSWDRIPGSVSLNGTTYIFEHTFTANEERIAFHDPYPYSRLLDMLPDWQAHPDADLSVIGQSVEGRDIHLLKITDADSSIPENERLGIWVLARQHSAEVTSSWSIEGMMDFVLSDEADANALRSKAVLNVIPFMNPDGATAGNYRDNAMGVNLNRVWDGSATLQNSPEVVAALEQIDAWEDAGNRFDWFFDFHSTAGAGPHFAFHPSASNSPSAQYHDDIERMLSLVNQYAPEFDPNRGVSNSADPRLAYHSMRVNRGIRGMTPEGTYSLQNLGPTPSEPLTSENHKRVGVAFARALIEFYDLSNSDAWRLY